MLGRPRVWWCRRGVHRGVEVEDALVLLQKAKSSCMLRSPCLGFATMGINITSRRL